MGPSSNQGPKCWLSHGYLGCFSAAVQGPHHCTASWLGHLLCSDVVWPSQVCSSHSLLPEDTSPQQAVLLSKTVHTQLLSIVSTWLVGHSHNVDCIALSAVASFQYHGLPLLTPWLFPSCHSSYFSINVLRAIHFPFDTALTTVHKYWHVVHLLPFWSSGFEIFFMIFPLPKSRLVAFNCYIYFQGLCFINFSFYYILVIHRSISYVVLTLDIMTQVSDSSICISGTVGGHRGRRSGSENICTWHGFYCL